MNISSVGVVGAGQMGNGIAHVFALAKFDVVLNDIDRGAIERALKLVETNLARQVNSGRI
ncbi:MAG: 3-hydroxybutyryl-CoA dehydrogenase, partial [Boseongicola sp. SB0677_bin_26]|nr:3-hydroxybutyryl-CoA dehydrogenase [Boseongicola sp. SB0677_bin_26]